MWLQFPPGQGNVLVPLAPASAAALGMTLYTASLPRSIWAQQALWALARTGGARLVPGERAEWHPPFTADEQQALREQWQAAAGRPIAAEAVYGRPQEHRVDSHVVLVCAGPASMLVRIRRDAAALVHERRVSEQAERAGLTAFRVPALRGAGEVAGWHWAGYEVMARRPHAPARTASDVLFGEAGALVEKVVERPAGVPADWRGAHRDLTPWNLRRAGRTRWLIDWEDAGYAPPGADAVYFAVTSAGIAKRIARKTIRVVERYPQAAHYWHSQLSVRELSSRDVGLVERMLGILSAGTA